MSSSSTTATAQTFDYYAVILDESGSMYDFAKDTLGSLRQFFNDQRKISTSDSQFHVTTFSTTTEPRFKGTLASELSFKYSPCGNTALYDAIGGTVNDVLNSVSRLDRKPNDVYIIIITDGYENSSSKYNQAAIKELIEKQKAHDWKFVFLGANQDAFKTGGSIGVSLDSCLNYAQNSTATPQALNAVSNGIKRQKAAKSMGLSCSSVQFTSAERAASNSCGYDPAASRGGYAPVLSSPVKTYTRDLCTSCGGTVHSWGPCRPASK